jgi:hypothetical protein
MNRTTRSLLVAALAAATAVPAGAQEVKVGSQTTITIRGFVSATAFMQDASFGFGNGQNAEWVNVSDQADAWFLSGDVRNTRLTLGIAGPEIGKGWKAGGTLEFDLFGGFAGTGPFSDEQPLLRTRLAYIDATKGGTTVRVGQAWSPLFGYVPASLSHIGFPLGYGSAGVVGWRFPGVFLYQNLSKPGAAVTTQLQLAAMRGSWNTGNVLDHQSAGEASSVPQLEARLDFSGKTAAGMSWGAYVVGHYDRKDLTGVGIEGDDDHLNGTAIGAGARIAPGPLTLHGGGYWGRAIGQQFGNLLQFGDLAGWGGWAQAGYAFHPNWSAWLFAGLDDVNDDDVRSELLQAPGDARTKNDLFSAMLRYNNGPYGVALEWLHADTKWTTRSVANTFSDATRSGNQIAASVFFSF